MSDFSGRLLTEKRKHRRHARRGTGYEAIPNSSIAIRVGNRRGTGYYNEIRVTSPRDAALFQRMVDTAVRTNPKDPLLIVVDGYQPWLEEIMATCIDDHYSEPGVTNREVQFSDTVQFPQRSIKRSKWVPWTFIIDQMNVPEVYYWTFGRPPPPEQDIADVDTYRFRIGAWTVGRGGYKFDDRVAVIVLFTLPTQISEDIVGNLLFTHLYKDAEYDAPRMDEGGICWLFLHLYDLLTDWQNIIRECERRLDESEVNSRGRNIPVKLRTRTMHKEVDRIYELNEYLRFHSRSFKKLIKLKSDVPKQEQDDQVWDQMDGAVDDLEQYGYYLDSLKERFNNLIELEFNIENATQSDNSRFLSILGTLFLPVSFLASLFGITTVTWPPIWYLYIAIPLFFLSLAFTIAFPGSVRRYQKYAYPIKKEHVHLTSGKFTMLGDQLPDSADVPKNIRYKNGGGADVRGGGAVQRRKGGAARDPVSGEDDGRGGRARSRSRGARSQGGRSRSTD